MRQPFLVYAHAVEHRGRMVFQDIRTRPMLTSLVRPDAEITEVLAVEDPDGDHWGWRTPDGAVGMIYASQKAFEACFTYGWAVEAARGKGEPIRLRLEPTGRRSHDPDAFTATEKVAKPERRVPDAQITERCAGGQSMDENELGQDYLDETRDKAEELLDALSRTNADPQIGHAVHALLEGLTGRVADLERTIFDPLYHAVRAMAVTHDVEVGNRELSSSTLADLLSLSDTAGRLSECLPEHPLSCSQLPDTSPSP